MVDHKGGNSIRASVELKGCMYNESFKTERVAKICVTQKTQDINFIPYYQETNTKLDIYVDGVYKGSTNFYPTIRLCKKFSSNKFKGNLTIVKES